MHYRLISIIALTLLLSVGAGALAQEPPDEKTVDPTVWAQVLELYEKAKETGEQVPKDVYEWVKSDFDKIGDWEYLVDELSLEDPQALQKRLNELGAERWECVWIHTAGKKTSFIFKRPAKTYLTNIPLSQLMKLIPGGADSGE